MVELPKLPPYTCGPETGHAAVWTPDQMRAYALEAIKAEREAPARWIAICDQRPNPEVFVLCWNGKETFVEWFGSKPDAGRGVTHWIPYELPPGAQTAMHDGIRARGEQA
jgi:hypothetical protein